MLRILVLCCMLIGSLHSQTTVSINSPNGRCDCEIEVDYNGNDLVSLPYSPLTLEECCSYCQLNANCLSFTHIPQYSQCWPKSTIEGRFRVVNSQGRVSCKKAGAVTATVQPPATTTLPTTTTTTTATTTTTTTTTQPTTTTTTSSGPSCMYVETGRNYPGNDIGQYLIVKDQSECCALCKPENGCNGWSYTSVLPVNGGQRVNFCALKSSMLNGVADSNWISGFSSIESQVCKTAPNYVKISCATYFFCTKDASNRITYSLKTCPTLPGSTTKLEFNESTQKCQFASTANCV